MTRTRIEAPRGVADVLPGAQAVRDAIVAAAKRYATNYGYERVITPTFEDIALFSRTSGEASDVVQKEMYLLTDRSGRELALRPEGTAPVARLYLEHGLHRQPQPVKLYYISPMFRYSRMQRGRYREFWQVGLEALGSDDPLLDAELIACFRHIIKQLRVQRIELQINSIGDRKCRPRYVKDLVSFLRPYRRRLDLDSRRRLEVSPLRIFESKDPGTQEILEGAPEIDSYLCSECAQHYRDVRSYLRRLRVPFRLNPRLVRGLDYYTRTVWEFLNPELGAQASICAGGRYDDLVEQLGGRPTPGVGWAAGIERIALCVDEKYVRLRPAVAAFFIFEDPDRKKEFLPLIDELRSERICDVAYGNRPPRKQYDAAVKRGSMAIVIVHQGTMITVRHLGEAKRFRSLRRLKEHLIAVLV